MDCCQQVTWDASLSKRPTRPPGAHLDHKGDKQVSAVVIRTEDPRNAVGHFSASPDHTFFLMRLSIVRMKASLAVPLESAVWDDLGASDMGYRNFRDSENRRWEVWLVLPTAAERRKKERRVATGSSAVTYTGPERRLASRRKNLLRRSVVVLRG